MTGLLVDEGRLVLKEGRWVATGDLFDVPVPPTISALLAARLDKLPARERRLLDIASVMGQIFTPPPCARWLAMELMTSISASRRSSDSRSSGASDSDLPEAEAFAFRHLLIRDAAYDAVPKATRAELHERFADWLDASEGSLGNQDEIVGYHLEQAYRYRVELSAESERERQLSDRAGRRLASAGEQAFARGDHHASIGLLSRASALLAIDDPLRLGLLSDPRFIARLGRRPDGGRAALDEAVQRAAAVSDDRMWMHASILRRISLDEGDEAEARREAERALVVFEAAGDERGLSRAWRLLSTLIPRTARR